MVLGYWDEIRINVVVEGKGATQCWMPVSLARSLGGDLG